ncbi:MAG: sigma-54-dependent Fis family transcriptional regulator, partial [Verrucomicrobiae bacterium]|nr:sigma-54-dependent Fis family transcriptional regulator [Verrucomicrobiae bacterium]
GAFLREFAEENGKPVRDLTADALQRLVDYDWPGNVRQLRTAIEHGVVMSNAGKIALRHLPAFLQPDVGAATGVFAVKPVRGAVSAAAGAAGTGGSALPGGDLDLARMEQVFVEEALRRTGGNRTEAARLLGISRRTLQRKLKDDDENEPTQQG